MVTTLFFTVTTLFFTVVFFFFLSSTVFISYFLTFFVIRKDLLVLVRKLNKTLGIHTFFNLKWIYFIFLTKSKCNESSSQCKVGVTRVGRLVGYFCSGIVSNLSRKILTDTEIKVLGNDLDFVPMQNKINEPKLLKNLHHEWAQNSISEINLLVFLRVLLLGLCYLETTYGPA